MRKLTAMIAVLALAGCGYSQKEYSAKEAESANYKKALQDETGKVAALETKNASLQQQNTALQGQVGDLQQRLTEAGSAKAEMEVTAGDYAKRASELESKQTVRLSEQVRFAAGSSKLSSEAKRTLDTVADALAPMKGKFILVAGFTDDTEGGGKGAALAAKQWQLSSARAQEVAKYLVGRGIDPGVIGVVGLGAARPVAANDSIANRGLNRRVEIALSPAENKLQSIQVKPATLQGK